MPELDFADVKPSVINVLIICLIVIAFIPLFKFAFTRFYVPGVSELVLSV